MAIKFEVGKTYSTRSMCDHNCIYRYTVTARRGNKLTLESNTGTRANRMAKILPYKPDVEKCWPMGSYSMAPVISADDTRVLKADWEV